MDEKWYWYILAIFGLPGVIWDKIKQLWSKITRGDDDNIPFGEK